MNRSPDGIGICRITKAATSLPPACIGRAVTTELATVPSASAMESMSFASRSDLIASSSDGDHEGGALVGGDRACRRPWPGSR